MVGFIVFTVVGLIITGIWYGSRLQKLTISQIEISAETTINKEVIKQIVVNQLDGTYFGLIPKRFTWFYPHDKILTAVSEVERIKNAEVERTDSKSIVVTYGEYVPDALWCKEKVSDDCLFLDETGYAFGRAPNLNGGSFLRFYTLQDSPTRGKQVVPTEDYVASKDFALKLADSGWFVRQVEIDSVRDVFYTLDGGSEVKTTLKEMASKTLGYLNTIRQSEEFKHLAPGNFQYIDLRFGTKVFVNEEVKTEETDSDEEDVTDEIINVAEEEASTTVR